MERKAKDQTLRHHAVEAMGREQEFCLQALQNSQYDAMSDDEWVELCEKISKRYLRRVRQAKS